MRFLVLNFIFSFVLALGTAACGSKTHTKNSAVQASVGEVVVDPYAVSSGPPVSDMLRDPGLLKKIKLYQEAHDVDCMMPSEGQIHWMCVAEGPDCAFTLDMTCLKKGDYNNEAYRFAVHGTFNMAKKKYELQLNEDWVGIKYELNRK